MTTGVATVPPALVLACCAWLTGAAPAAAQAPTEPPQTDDGGLRVTWDNRPEIHFGSIAEVRIRGRLENTIRTPQSDEGLDADAMWQTRRLEFEGVVLNRIEFELSREFGDSFEPERDAFVNVRVNRGFELQAGRFKMPFSRDVLTPGANLDFVSRSLAGRILAPGRDVGAMAHGRLFDRVLSYEAGYFRGDGDRARTSQVQGGQHALAGRAVVAPWGGQRASRLARLEAAVAVTASDVDGRLGLRGSTVFEDGVFFDRVVVNGRRLRRGLEAAWSDGPMSLTWEHITVTDQRNGMGIDGEALPGVRASGWYAAGTWTVTGEPKRGRIEPRTSVIRGGRGAIQVSARYERLAFEPAAPVTEQTVRLGLDTPANAERVLTLGVAWYLSRYFRVQANAVFERIEDAQRSPSPRSDGRFGNAVFQLQVAM